MGETIGILFIFFMLIVFGAIFYVRIKSVSVTREIAEFQDVRSVELAQTISFLPEFQCTELNVVQPGCFDLQKMKAMQQIFEANRGFYLRELGQIKINVSQIYPPGPNIVPYDNSPGNYSSSSVSNIPISLFDVAKNKYYLGVMTVTVFS